MPDVPVEQRKARDYLIGSCVSGGGSLHHFSDIVVGKNHRAKQDGRSRRIIHCHCLQAQPPNPDFITRHAIPLHVKLLWGKRGRLDDIAGDGELWVVREAEAASLGKSQACYVGRRSLKTPQLFA